MKTENDVEILEEGAMFFMKDDFNGTTLIFEVEPDGSAGITIRDQYDRDINISMWPIDFLKLKEFLNKPVK